MPAGVYDSWKAYFKEEPFGHPWQNWLMAMNTSFSLSPHVKKSPDFSTYFYEDPDYKRERQDGEFFAFLESKVKH